MITLLYILFIIFVGVPFMLFVSIVSCFESDEDYKENIKIAKNALYKVKREIFRQ